MTDPHMNKKVKTLDNGQTTGELIVKSKEPGRPGLVRSDSFSNRIALNHSRFAKRVHDIGYVYTLYALLDAEILAYTGLKWFSDIFASNKGSANPLRDWLLTPSGIAIASVESVAFIGLSLLANKTEEDDPRPYRQAIMTLWPYCRNVISELKNANKGVRNALKVAALFHETSLNSIMMPAGLLVGSASVLNRIWFRRLQDQRKELKNNFKTLLKDIAAHELNDAEKLDINLLKERKGTLKEFYDKIPSEMNAQQRYAYLSAAYNGMLEGLAYYIAPLALMGFTSPAFIPVASVCIVLSTAAITARVYEEYEYQRGLELETLGVKLQLKRQELGILNAQLALFKSTQVPEADKDSQRIQQEELTRQYAELAAEIIHLGDELNAKTAGMVNHALRGVKNGLAVYAVVTKMLMTSLMFFSAVPTALLVSNAVIGVALLVGSTIYSLSQYYKKLTKAQENPNQTHMALEDVYSKANRILAELIETHTMAATPGTGFYTEWLDVVRAFFSGLNKGQKLIGYILTISFLEVSLHNDFQDKPIVLKTSVALGIFCSVVLSLRVYALNFGSKANLEVVDGIEETSEELLFLEGIEDLIDGQAKAKKLETDKQPSLEESTETDSGISEIGYEIEMVALESNSHEAGDDVITVGHEKNHTDKAATVMHAVDKSATESAKSEPNPPHSKRPGESEIDTTAMKKSKTMPESTHTATERRLSIRNMVLQGMSFFTDVVHPLTHHKHDTSELITPPRKE